MNINKVRYFIHIIYLVIILSPCFPQDKSPITLNEAPEKKFLEDLNFSFGTGLSYLNGQYKEIVYPPAPSVNQYYSELLWNLDNIILLDLTIGARMGLWSLDLSISTAVTKETGKMTDTDWLDIGSTDNTHWSLSRIWLDNSFLMDTEITRSFNISKNISIRSGLGYKLNFWDWEDKVLDFVYQDPQPPDFIGKNGIDYKVIQNIFYASTELILTTGIISSGINFDFSPFIYAWDMDHHILTNTFYIDTFIANFWYRAELTLNIKTGSKRGFLFTAYIEELAETVGNTYNFDEDPSDSDEIGNQTGYYPDGAGMASFMWGIGLSYIWSF